MKKYLLDRELSWLNFNKRVLDLSQSKDISLKDRLFLYSIAHSNLDEFLHALILLDNNTNYDDIFQKY